MATSAPGIPKEQKSVHMRIMDCDSVRFKTILVSAVLLLTAVYLLFADLITYTEPRASISIPFRGIALLQMLFTGLYAVPVTAGKLAFTVELPPLFVLLYAALLLLLLGLLAVLLVNGFGRRKTMYPLGLGMAGWSLAVFAFYLVMICSSSVTAVDRSGKLRPLFTVYDIGIAFLVAVLALLLAGGIQFGLKAERVKKVKRYWFIYCLLIIPTVCMVLFSYYPIFMQTVVSFKDYKITNGIWGSDWVGLKHFQTIFQSQEILGVIGNSIYLSLLRIAASTLPPILLALFLFEIGGRQYRKILQSVVYIPHFFGWVIIYSVFYALLGNAGIVNQLLMAITGDGTFYIDFLTNPGTIVPTLIVSQIWKEMGWGTILYLAALSNIDPALYEAASIDGAGAMKKLFKITLPSIMSVVVFLFILSLGSLLNNGLEQILLFANLAVRDKVNTIELWVYNQGIGKLDYGLSSAMGFAQSLIGLALVLCANKLSIKTTDRGLW